MKNPKAAIVLGGILAVIAAFVFNHGKHVAEQGATINRILVVFENECGPRIDRWAFTSYFGSPNTDQDVQEARQRVSDCWTHALKWAKPRDLDVLLTPEGADFINASLVTFRNEVAKKVAANERLPTTFSDAGVMYPSQENATSSVAIALLICAIVLVGRVAKQRARERHEAFMDELVEAPKPEYDRDPAQKIKRRNLPAAMEKVSSINARNRLEDQLRDAIRGAPHSVDDNDYLVEDEDEDEDEGDRESERLRHLAALEESDRRRNDERVQKKAAADSAAERRRTERSAQEQQDREHREQSRRQWKQSEQDQRDRERKERQAQSEKRQQEQRARDEERVRRREKAEYERRERELEIVYKNRTGHGTHTSSGGNSVRDAMMIADGKVKTGMASGYVIRNKNGKVQSSG
jgi:hypothetical protein